LNEWLKLVLFILINYRLAQLFVFDEGPFSVFDRLRRMAGAYDYDSQGRVKTNLGRLMKCPYCLGVWFALPLGIWAGGIQWYIWWLAIAGGQVFLQGLSDAQS
jgi:hypothetical protein